MVNENHDILEVKLVLGVLIKNGVNFNSFYCELDPSNHIAATSET